MLRFKFWKKIVLFPVICIAFFAIAPFLLFDIAYILEQSDSFRLVFHGLLTDAGIHFTLSTGYIPLICRIVVLCASTCMLLYCIFRVLRDQSSWADLGIVLSGLLILCVCIYPREYSNVLPALPAEQQSAVWTLLQGRIINRYLLSSKMLVEPAFGLCALLFVCQRNGRRKGKTEIVLCIVAIVGGFFSVIGFGVLVSAVSLLYVYLTKEKKLDKLPDQYRYSKRRKDGIFWVFESILFGVYIIFIHFFSYHPPNPLLTPLATKESMLCLNSCFLGIHVVLWCCYRLTARNRKVKADSFSVLGLLLLYLVAFAPCVFNYMYVSFFIGERQYPPAMEQTVRNFDVMTCLVILSLTIFIFLQPIRKWKVLVSLIMYVIAGYLLSRSIVSSSINTVISLFSPLLMIVYGGECFLDKT